MPAPPDRPARHAIALTTLLVVGCSGGGTLATLDAPGEDPGGAQAFALVSVNVQQDDIWHVNRPIELRFSAPVAFGSVGSQSIRIESAAGVPAVGEFELAEPDLVVFRPSCPTTPDLSDAGLEPGAVLYRLQVFDASSADGPLVFSAGGAPLALGADLTFLTSFSGDPAGVLLDLGVGAPQPLLREAGSHVRGATRLELGDGASVFFETDPVSGAVSVPLGVPLDLSSVPASAVAVVVELDQPIDFAPENLAPDRIALEFEDPLGLWRRVETASELVANCTATGATVRLDVREPLPQARRLRVVLGPEFADLVGQTNDLPLDSFARFETTAVRLTGFDPPGAMSDERRVEFDDESWRDLELDGPCPPAAVAGGALLPEAGLAVGCAGHARSVWMPLGGATLTSSGAPSRVRFLVDGLDPRTGEVLDRDADGFVDLAPPLLGPTTLAPFPGLPSVDRTGRRVVLDATALFGKGDDVYLRNPHLLERSVLAVAPTAAPWLVARREVATASYDAGTGRLELTIANTSPPLLDDVPGPATVALHPRSFLVVTDGTPDRLPAGWSLRLAFQATGETDSGAPDVDAAQPWTADAGTLGGPGVAWYRFEVEFHRDAEASTDDGVPRLDFARLPFRF